MLHWIFPPRSPLPAQQAAWVEWRLRWLLRRLGHEQFLKQQFVPSDCVELVSDLTDRGTRASILLGRLAARFGIPTVNVRLHIVEAKDSPTAAGSYFEEDGLHHVVIKEDTLDDAQRLVTTMAHELLHALLLGRQHLRSDDPDHEATTDLALIYFGLGVPATNAIVREAGWHEGLMQHWSVSRIGYLSTTTMGYALAVAAHWREERAPRWARELQVGARDAFRKATRHLRRRQGLMQPPLTSSIVNQDTTAREVAAKDPKLRLTALLTLARSETPPRCALVEQLLADTDREVAHAATRLIGPHYQAELSEQAVDLLTRRALGMDRALAAASLSALVETLPEDPRTEKAITTLFQSSDQTEVTAALGAAALIGPNMRSLSPLIARRLTTELSRQRPLARELVQALTCIAPDPMQELEAHMPGFAIYRDRCRQLLDELAS